MAVSLTHATVATGTDAENAEIGKVEWNENHALTLSPGYFLGRITAGTGAAEEAMAYRVIGMSAVGWSHTGDLVNTQVASLTIPGGTLGPNGSLRITSLWSMTNNANAKNIRVSFGSAWLQATGHTNTACVRTQNQINNRNSATSQVAGSTSLYGFGATTSTYNTHAVDTTANQTVGFWAELTNAADTLTLEAYTVELGYAP